MIIKMLEERRDDPEGLLCSVEYDKVIEHIKKQDRYLRRIRGMLEASHTLLIKHDLLPED